MITDGNTAGSAKDAPLRLPITPARFVSTLIPAHGLAELRALPSKARTFCDATDAPAISAFVEQHLGDNLYVGVASRRDATGGTLANCERLAVLFADLDFKSRAEGETRAALAAFPLPPSLVVESGGGLHPYWRLRDPLDVSRDAARAKHLLRRLAHHLEGDLAAAEPARILRLPGTFNYKYTPPRPVTVSVFEPTREYSVIDFERVLPPEPSAGPSTGLGPRIPASEWAGWLRGVPRGQRHTVAAQLAGHFLGRGLPVDEVEEIVVAFGLRCAPPVEHLDELRRLVRDLAKKDGTMPYVVEVRMR
jgi:hypothetical protein